MWEETCYLPGGGDNVIWWKLVGNWVCWNARVLVWCVVLGEGGWEGDPTMTCTITKR